MLTNVLYNFVSSTIQLDCSHKVIMLQTYHMHAHALVSERAASAIRSIYAVLFHFWAHLIFVVPRHSWGRGKESLV